MFERWHNITDYRARTTKCHHLSQIQDVASALKRLGFRVDLLTNAGLQKMEDAVAQFGTELSASPDSVGFFYYAGHGVQKSGSNYLIPSNAYVAGPGFLQTNTLQLQSVLNTLHNAGNRLNIVVLDACRNNPFNWSRSIAGGRTRGLAVVGSQPQGSVIAYASSPRLASLAAASLTPGTIWIPHALPSKQAWISVTYGNGTFVALSTGSNVPAFSKEGSHWRNSVLPNRRAWKSVSYGGGTFLALSLYSTVGATSKNGVTWRSASLPSREG